MNTVKFFTRPRNILLSALAIIVALTLIKFVASGNILGAKTNVAVPTSTPISSPKATIQATASATPKTQTKTTPKSTYKIAMYGDSMVDTMGDNLEYLQKALSSIYPATKINLYNYGIGAQNVEAGVSRFEKEFNYKERKYPSIVDLKPDIIILGSFAYNPFSDHDAQKHLSLLSQLTTKALKVTPNLYLLAEIAPLKENFGKGEHGINWPEDMAAKQAAHIVEQLENAENLAKTRKIALVDAFAETQQNGKFGHVSYVNGDDGIHPSVAGHVLMANLIARTLVFK